VERGYDEVEKLCREILSPLVRADGGEMYLVAVSADDVHIHLAGTCAGCPGAQMTRDRMIVPLLHTAAPKLNVRVTTGWKVPEGAKAL
jgi:Fe-S cluster biogenesis protein NfuA